MGGVSVDWGGVSVGSMTIRVVLAVAVSSGDNWLTVADGSLGGSWCVTVRAVSTVMLVVLRVRDFSLGDSGGSNIGVTVAVTVAAVASSRRVLLGGSISVVGSRSVLLPGVGAGDSHCASGKILH